MVTWLCCLWACAEAQHRDGAVWWSKVTLFMVSKGEGERGRKGMGEGGRVGWG